MKKLIFLLFVFSTLQNIAQTEEDKVTDAETYQTSQNEKFSNPETSILLPEDLKTFEGLEVYPIDVNFRVEENFVRTPNEKPFLMPTTTTRLPEYVKYGEVHFKLKGKKLKLNLYQDTDPNVDPEYKDYLFLPFTDLTSGEATYGGGRFLDAYIPEGDTIVIDFNKSYNPYCAYNPNYSCPIPPAENHLDIEIEAGVKKFKGH